MIKSAKFNHFLRKFDGKEKGDSLRERHGWFGGGFVFRAGSGYLLP